ncbi:PTS ascorbate transporter subunit IIC [Mycoplasma crocodyli]|uniref:Ascorbate-specific PTS system EIIC component n=1 Tax=Mycoplasma crocodyli (strain ATCC 51981 / MP145) TaxID=512564 RepID=D5E519_MYCCM|nr:PTS ascorbate transporter subunit IIC [Mycoplasma crocodyli]ADE19908.1 PTS system, IIC component [Mycoplasma crocodyli MP145]
MEFLNWTLGFFKDFVAIPAFLVGIFTLIGALILRKKGSQVIISMFKVIIGFLILGGGAGVLVGSLSAFQPVFQATYNLSGVIPNNDAFAGALTKISAIATLGSLIMVLGMLLNLVLAFVSRFKYVYLSGHVLFYASLMIATVFITLGFNPDNAGDFAIMLIGGATLLGSYMVISPAVQQRHMNMIVGSNEIGLGHTGGFGYAISGYIGEGIGKLMKGKVISTEAIKFPKGLYFFRNTLVSLSITVLVFYIFAFLPGGILYELGKFDAVNQASAISVLSQRNWIVTMLVQAFVFTAGVEIMLSGVRLFIGELIPTFKGISDKLIKDSKAAVDCPVVFPYAPNAVLIGFISSFVAGIIGMAITIGLNYGGLLSVIILPGLIPHFFLGATSGVFGNVKGGIVGAIVGPFVHGIIITLVPAIFIWGKWVPVSSETLSTLVIATDPSITSTINSLNWGDTDYIIGALPGLFGLINKYVGFAVCVALYIGLIIDGIVYKFIKKNKPEINKEVKEEDKVTQQA